MKLNSKDEYRYHEAITHPAMTTHPRPTKVLVLGGGDGMVIRELLKYPTLEDIHLIDNQEKITNHIEDSTLSKQNNYSLSDNRITLLDTIGDNVYDVIIIDELDKVGSSYTIDYFRLIYNKLDDHGLIAINSGSLTHTPDYVGCVVATMVQAGYYATPMHIMIPSTSGDIAIMIGSKKLIKVKTQIIVPTRHIGQGIVETMMIFGKDERIPEIEPNSVDNQVISQYLPNQTPPPIPKSEIRYSEAQNRLSEL